MEKTRWGIVGTGNIAGQFAQGLQTLDDAVIAGVASRSISKAKEFSKRYGSLKVYGSYESMLEAKDIDVVYIATPHTLHLKDVTMFLNAGFNVLSEKPMGVNARETQQMIAAARQNNVFLMEGMWTRFFPAVKQAVRWVREGRIGQIQLIRAGFGYDGSADRSQWRFQNEHAGGALLDVGIYPLALSFQFLGTNPSEITGACNLTDGIDETNAFILKYPEGQLALLCSGIAMKTDKKALVEGTLGRVVIHGDFWHPTKAELILSGDDQSDYTGESVVFEEKYEATGFQFEARAVQECLKKGLKESPVLPLNETLKIAQTMDALREMWHLKYPSDDV
jgi:predicted dehydrogenase